MAPFEILQDKFGAEVEFHPFFLMEALSGKEFRAKKINLPDYTAVVFSSRLAIDAYFKLCEEMRFKVPETMKEALTGEELTEEQLQACLESPLVSRIYLEGALFGADAVEHSLKMAKAAGKRLSYAMPHVYRREAERYFSEKEGQRILALIDTGRLDVLVRDLDGLARFRDSAFGRVTADYACYCQNSLARDFYREQGASITTVPLELSRQELLRQDLSQSEMIVYGSVPVMVSAGCIQKNTSGCDGAGRIQYLRDRKNSLYPVVSLCRCCYNLIYHPSKMQFSCSEDFRKATGLSRMRYQFLTENRQETAAVLAGTARSTTSDGMFYKRID